MSNRGGRIINGERLLTGKQLAEIKISSLPRIGDKRAKLFHKLGIYNFFDLLYYLPNRYEDRRFRETLEGVKSGEQVTVLGRIENIQEVRLRRNLTLLKVGLSGNFGNCTALWFNQPFLKKSLRSGSTIAVTGKLGRDLYGYEISVIDHEIDIKNHVHVGRIVPIYRTTERMSQRSLRRVMYQFVASYADQIKDLIPPELSSELKLVPLAQALKEIHFPSDQQGLSQARERLVCEELLFFKIGLSEIQYSIKSDGVACLPKAKLTEDFLSLLPFPLTGAQQDVLKEIQTDMASSKRMYRLLQGDVGCGKTIVALYALLYTVAAGFQGALMVPTEVLAEQHFLGIDKYVEQLGVSVDFLTGSLGKKEREQCLESLQNGTTDIIIGTHALLQDEVAFANLGLIVIDEQHRFGVKQRDRLLAKANAPDVLIMTATPIPRSLTLTVYGDLDLSVIDELPPGRKEIKTYFMPVSEKNRVYGFVRTELEKGRQAFVVCPLIEESEHLDVEAAIVRHQELSSEFSEFQVALLHGKLKFAEKERVMNDFRRGNSDLLVATSVIEVGIDVPNATIIVIEGVERFGLAQLHQLRGRVGRGTQESFCVLIGNPQTEEARERIKIFVQNHDGFQVAEKDLVLRGPGELLGTKQHGYSDFRVVDIFRDTAYFKKIENLIKNGEIHPNDELSEEIDFRFPLLIYGMKM
ncbi:MAG: ATP-dependent DNA helicase RecG [Syntrophaceticus sp.]|nr:ATP-dependent DNA helicase RecG [Syntrophaceticus sp.]MDD4359567.1 ATP-dependent DNA helicase RecG [Syntrophaceticus sp.]MDD4782997.1 ATP-dependent DNA helicase RecG [Syntrophaceticus sp.]